MTILLTGATGLVGYQLALRLSKGGHHVIALVRDQARAKRRLPFVDTFHVWDGSEILPAEILGSVDAVVHLMGESIAEGRWTAERKRRLWDSRVQSTLNLVQSINQYGPRIKVFISSSAVGYYGDRGDSWVNEQSESGQGFLAELCRAWEGATKNLKSEVRSVQLRTGVVLAREGGFLAKVGPVFRYGLGGKLGSGRQWMSWIHLDDLLSLILFSLESSSVYGPINAVSPEPMRNLEVTRVLKAIYKRPAIFTVPKLALKLVFGEMSKIFLESQRVSAQQVIQLGFRFKFPDFTSAMQDLAGQAKPS